MRLEDLNWMDVEAYLKTDDRLILVTGATEQHGYLSLLTDIKIPLALAEAGGRQSGVLVAPPLNFGCSPYFLAYPGTLSLRASTLMDVIEDLVRSAHQTGFRRLFEVGALEHVREVVWALAQTHRNLYDNRLGLRLTGPLFPDPESLSI